MNLSTAQIEDIVRVVVERLQTNAAAPEVQPAVETNNTAAIEAVAGEVRLNSRVITLDSLNGQLNGARELVVHPKAVVTPAVKDELRQRGIRLVRRLPAAKSTANRSAPLLLVTDASHHAALSRAVCSQQATTVAANNIASGVAQLTQNFANAKRGAVWCTHSPFASLAATFGDSRFRALQLSEIRDLPTALVEAQPNVIIVDCAKWKAPAVASLVRDWFRSLR